MRSTHRLTVKTQVELNIGQKDPYWVPGTVSYVGDGSHYIIEVSEPRGRYAVTPGHPDLRVG